MEANHAVHRLPVLTEAPAYAPLALHDVRAGYGRITVLHDVDVAVPRAKVAALLGPNGAGKSTTLGVMSGLLEPTAGCRHVEGRHLNEVEADELARIGICHVREGRSIFPNLTVEDNLLVAASCGVDRERVRDVTFTLFPRLRDRRRQLAGSMSGGEQQMLALSRALATDPAVILIDELSMGLAPRLVAELYEAVGEIARGGVSVLIVEQFASIGLRYAEHVYVMGSGRVRYSGPSAGAHGAVHDAYLGAAE